MKLFDKIRHLNVNILQEISNNIRSAVSGDKSREWTFLFSLTVSFISLILILLFAWGIFEIFFNFKAQKNVIFSQQRYITQNAANRVAGFVQEKFIAMETTARLIDPSVTPQEVQERAINYLLRPHPAFRQLVFINTAKRRTAATSRLSEEGSLAMKERFDDGLFNHISMGKNYISSVYVDKITSEPLVIMAVPCKDVFEGIRGGLIAEVNLKFMWELVNSIKIGKTGLAYVADQRGNLIAFRDISRVLKGDNVKNIFPVAEFLKMKAAPTATYEASEFTGINEAKVIGTYSTLGTPNWIVVTELPVSEAYSPAYFTIIITIIFSILIALFAIELAVSRSKNLTDPIVHLMKTAQRITKGELELEAEPEGPVEIRLLAKNFNSMTARLRELIGSLEQRNRHLQNSVKKYVEFMAEVGRGGLDARLDIEEDMDNPDDPLITLGRQLNDTTSSLQKMVGQIQSTTEKLKKQEQDLHAYSEKLAKSNKELEQFAYTASHDLQEPLRKIQFFGSRLKTNYENVLEEKAIDYIDRMINAVTRMENFIKDLLQYSRISTMAKPPEKVDLNEAVKEVLGDLDISIQETKAAIKIDNLPVIDAEPMQIRQLFQNIIGNAIKYRRTDAAPNISITCRATGNENNSKIYEINITDNGIGFDNSYSEKIFGLFQRLHGKSEYEGTGIGLALCKKIVEQHGGSIKAYGKVNEGSVFIIMLPVKHDSIV